MVVWPIFRVRGWNLRKSVLCGRRCSWYDFIIAGETDLVVLEVVCLSSSINGGDRHAVSQQVSSCLGCELAVSWL